MLAQKVGDFARVGALEATALLLQVFNGFNNRLGHFIVRLGRATHQGEPFTLGDTFVSVFLIQADTEQVVGSRFPSHIYNLNRKSPNANVSLILRSLRFVKFRGHAGVDCARRAVGLFYLGTKDIIEIFRLF